MIANAGDQPVARDVARRGTRRRGRRSRATSTPTSRSSARATPGLWTAYALKRADPTLRIVVCEAEVARLRRVGPQRRMVLVVLRRQPRRDRTSCTGARASSRCNAAMFATVDEIESVVEAEADRLRLGARRDDRRRDAARAHRRGCSASSTQSVRYGFGEDDYRWLEPDEARSVIGCTPNLGALFIAALRGDTSRQAGSRPRACRRTTRRHDLRRNTASTAIEPGRVRTTHGAVRADIVVRARPKRSRADLPGLQRALVPIYSLMIATEPLAGVVLGGRRPRRPSDVHRLPPHGHLRAAHRRRSDRVRRPRRAVSLRLARPIRRST